MTNFARFRWLKPSEGQDALIYVNPQHVKSLSLRSSIDGRSLVIESIDATAIAVLPVDEQGNVLKRAHRAPAETILNNAAEYIRRASQG